ncbi:hypothetical protein C5167_002929 [Papaver somniferum]|uniref:Dolichyl-diphosphooligosaccharide--protein glycosyltransferase subunit 4 n=1 Tax=Papaver somniferum TaxID=3469 RepID=A0A4Y7L2Y0_PAPSO|nr:hypothetical protein C5167_002929 [Papaver somniferum]
MFITFPQVESYSPVRLDLKTGENRAVVLVPQPLLTMIDDQDLGFFANFLGIFIFVLVIAYHYVVADPKYATN